MSTATATSPVVRESFQDLIPTLTDAEWNDLGESLDHHGLIDALIVWNDPATGEDVLLDGHHRLTYCNANSIPWRVTKIELPDEDAAREWVVTHQLGRRNLPQHLIAEFRGRQYAAQKATLGTNQHTRKSHDGLSTADRLAEQHGVSRNTIKRAADYAARIDDIASHVCPDDPAKALEEVRRQGLSGPEADALAQDPPSSPEELESRVAEQRALAPPRPVNAEGAWGQKSIVGADIRRDESGAEYVHSYDLSCGHVWVCRRKKAPSGRKTAPCETCCPGTRTPADRQREERQITAAVARAAQDETLAPELVALVRVALRLVRTRPGAAAVARLRDEIDRHARMAGLYEEVAA